MDDLRIVKFIKNVTISFNIKPELILMGLQCIVKCDEIKLTNVFY